MTLSRETLALFVVLVLYATVTKATQVLQCKTGRAYEDPNLVKISACEAPPCILKRKTTTKVELRFVPQKDIESLITLVSAEILGLPVPFIGVNGVTACDRVYNSDGSKAGCPLSKGKEYLYKNSFPVLSVYPRIQTVVHWALNDGTSDVTCFQVPAKIVS